MAEKTPCQTPGAQYHITVGDKAVTCAVDLPIDLNLDEGRASLLEANLHNVLELVLAPYFAQRRRVR